MAGRKPPSPELLRKFLDYDPKTGALTWKPRTGRRSSWWNKLHAGKIAGTVTPAGYVAVKIMDQSLLAHRIVWAMVHGSWPECIVHRNANRGDNRLKNLCDTSRKAIQRGPQIYRSNTSGIRGVSWAKARQKWLASIRVDDCQIHLGLFDSKAEAARARQAAERKRDRARPPL